MQQELNAQELRVITPEQVRLRFQTAGPGSRASAHAIDLALLGLFFSLLIVLLAEVIFRSSGWAFRPSSDYMIAIVVIVVSVSLVGYFVVCECTMGQTVGGRIIGLRVLQDNGQPITVLSSVLRNLLRIIDILPFGYTVGLVTSFLHPQGKRLGDLLAGTVVIYDRSLAYDRKEQKKGPVIDQLTREGWSMNSFVLDERQRRMINRDEWMLIKELVERRNDLAEDRWMNMTDECADYLIGRLELSPEDVGRVTKRSVLITIYAQVRDDWEL